MAAGYLGLAIPGDTAFWISLLLIILGNGFFKPNISTVVGNLYAEEKYQPFKDAGYNIFYMGINIGAFVCNFVAAYLRNYYGWGYAFAAAGIGMIIGIIWFLSGRDKVKHRKGENRKYERGQNYDPGHPADQGNPVNIPLQPDPQENKRQTEQQCL